MDVVERIYKSPKDIQNYIYEFIPNKYCNNCFKKYKSFSNLFCSKRCSIYYNYRKIKDRSIFFFSYFYIAFFFISVMCCTIFFYFLILFFIVKITYNINYQFSCENKFIDHNMKLLM